MTRKPAERRRIINMMSGRYLVIRARNGWTLGRPRERPLETDHGNRRGGKMNVFRCLLLVLLVSSVALGAGSGGGEQDAVFQTSASSALLAGVYDGQMTIGELREHGGFGLGTWDALDGEMVAVDGDFYQIRIDGVASRASDSATTPFAVVKRFQVDRTLALTEKVDFAGLTAFLDRSLPTRNVMYAIRIDGRFNAIQARSVPPQNRPYPPLADALTKQRTFDFRDVSATLVGFRTPGYMQGVNVAGYHFHFVTADRKAGGHVLACELENLTIQVDEARDLRVALPQGPGFDQADLGP
jgi:acetolactate decarboxylase